jgi:hypothetical protein
VKLPTAKDNYSQSSSFSQSISYSGKAVVIYTHLDNCYVNDIKGYIDYLDRLRNGIKQMLEGMLLTLGEEKELIENFLTQHSSSLAMLDLEELNLLLLSMTQTQDKRVYEELKSRLFYHLFYIMESLKGEVKGKESTIAGSEQFPS